MYKNGTILFLILGFVCFKANAQPQFWRDNLDAYPLNEPRTPAANGVETRFNNAANYSLTLTPESSYGLSLAQAFALQLANNGPTNISLSKANLFENNAIGAVIGSLSSTDTDAGATHTYSLIGGDVAAFTILGNQLKAGEVYNYVHKNVYTLRIRTTNAQGSSFDKDFTISISQAPVLTGTGNPLGANVATLPSTNPSISKGFKSQLTVTGANLSNYSWSPSTGSMGASAVVAPTSTTTYSVTVTNNLGSSTTLSITVKVNQDYVVVPHNILTPNGDGKNDRWVVENIEYYPKNQVRILDRTGREVYATKSYKNDWTGDNLAEGTYYYIIGFAGLTKISPQKGFLTIVR